MSRRKIISRCWRRSKSAKSGSARFGLLWSAANSPAEHFVVLDPEAAIEASDIATETGVRGMDAIVIQTAKDYKTTLVSLDAEMMVKAAGTVRIRNL